MNRLDKTFASFLFIAILLLSFTSAFAQVEQTFHFMDENGSRNLTYYTDSEAGFIPNQFMTDEPSAIWQINYASQVCRSAAVVNADFIAAGNDLNGSGVEIYDTWGDGTALASITGNNPRVAACDVNNMIIKIDNYTNPSTQLIISAYDADSNDPSTAVWTVTLDNYQFSGDKPVAISGDGNTAVVGVWNTVSTQGYFLLVDVMDGTYTEYSPGANYSGISPRTVRISDDASIIACIFGSNLLVFDDDGEFIWEHDMGFGNDAMDISGDGSIIAYGWSNAEIFRWDETSTIYQPFTTVPDYGYCGEVAVSADGNYVAFGWYSSSYDRNKVCLYSVEENDEVFNYEYPQTTGEFQDLPSAMDISDDGRYFAMGVWGDSDSDRELACFDREMGSDPVFTLDLPGSVFGMDMSADGDIVAVGGKHVHANQMGSGGDLAAIHIDASIFPGTGQWIYFTGTGISGRVHPEMEVMEQFYFMMNPRAVDLSSNGHDVYMIGGQEFSNEALYHYDALLGEDLYLSDIGFNDVRLSNDENLVYTAGADGISAWDINNSTLINSWSTGEVTAARVEVGPDGSVLALTENGNLYFAPQGDFQQWQPLMFDAFLAGGGDLTFHPSGHSYYAAGDLMIFQFHHDGGYDEIMLPESFGFYGISADPSGEGLYVRLINYATDELTIQYLETDQQGNMLDFVDDFILDCGYYENTATGKYLDVSPDGSYIAAIGDGFSTLFTFEFGDDMINLSTPLNSDGRFIRIDPMRYFAPELNMVPSQNVIFGAVQINAQAERQITLSNNGGGYLWIDSIEEPELTEYSITNGLDFPLGLEAGQTHTLTFTFNPETTGAFIDTLGLRLSNGEIYDVILLGQGYDTSVDENDGLPTEFAISLPAPNPFNNQTIVQVALPQSSDIKWNVVNINGREVSSGKTGIKSAGYHPITFDGSDWATGIYFCKIQAGDQTKVLKLHLIK